MTEIIVQYMIPNRLCLGAPGVSDKPTINAPRDMNVPIKNLPRKAHTITGIIDPKVIRIPSAKY